MFWKHKVIIIFGIFLFGFIMNSYMWFNNMEYGWLPLTITAIIAVGITIKETDWYDEEILNNRRTD